MESELRFPAHTYVCVCIYIHTAMGVEEVDREAVS
jgi:hypothetical protein